MFTLPVSFYVFCGFGIILWILFFIFWSAWKTSKDDKKKAKHEWAEDRIHQDYLPGQFGYNPWPQARYESASEDCTFFGCATMVLLTGAMFCTAAAVYKGVMAYM